MRTHRSPSPEVIDAWTGLLRVAKQSIESVDDALKHAGLPPLGWYDALREIAQAGSGGLRPFQLVDRMLIAQYSVSRLLDRLEAGGLIERDEAADDGRGQVVRITAEGRRMRRAIWAVYGPAIASLVGDKLTSEEASMLTAILGKLRNPAN